MRRPQLRDLISTFRCSYQVPPGVSGELVATTQPTKQKNCGRFAEARVLCCVAIRLISDTIDSIQLEVKTRANYQSDSRLGLNCGEHTKHAATNAMLKAQM